MLPTSLAAVRYDPIAVDVVPHVTFRPSSVALSLDRLCSSVVSKIRGVERTQVIPFYINVLVIFPSTPAVAVAYLTFAGTYSIT